MRLRSFPFTLLAAAVFFAASAPAQMPDVPPGKWWKRPAIVEQLALTPEQQDKLDAILAKDRRSFVDLKADVEKKQLDVEELMAKKDSDPKKVAAAVDALGESRGRLRKAALMMVLEMRGVLTDVQWKMVVERREKWREEQREQMRERRPGRGRFGAPGPPETPPPAAPK
jgi:Spy/CpxP family protein refolding chaperone